MTGCFQLISYWADINFYSNRNTKRACLFLIGNITLQYLDFKSYKWLMHFIHHFPKTLYYELPPQASMTAWSLLWNLESLAHCGEEHNNEKFHCIVTFTEHKEPGLCTVLNQGYVQFWTRVMYSFEPGLCTVLDQVPAAQLAKAMGLIQWMQKRWPSNAIKLFKYACVANQWRKTQTNKCLTRHILYQTARALY